MSANIFSIAHRHNDLRLSLLDRYPELANDEDALSDTLEGVSDLKDVAARLCESIADAEAMAESIGARMKLMKDRKARYEAKADERRRILADILATAEESLVRLPNCTVTLTTTARGVVVTDPAQIPPEFLRSPPPGEPKPDLKAIGAALKDGKAVPGCELGGGIPSVQIRRL
jgi:Siphovirus Gp157